MGRVIVLDTNLLLLLVVGLTQREYIPKVKRLRPFDVADFDILAEIVAASAGLCLTPNVLTETSNLLRFSTDPMRSEIAMMLKAITGKHHEEAVPSRVAMSRRQYLQLGLTDAVLLEAATSGGTIWTADFDLYHAARSAGLRAKNFHYERDLRRQDFK